MEEKPVEVTKSIAEFITGTNPSDIPTHVYDHAKICFLDWLGVALAGKDDPLVSKLIQYTHMMGGNEQATVIGHGMKKSLEHATLINGAASHALDYDDSLISFIGHPSVTLFPSLLGLAEWKEKSGHDFLTAYIIGLKAGSCIGGCAGFDHYLAGWHGTSTIGHLASAAGSSKLLDLNLQQTLYALGIAGTQASGLKRVFGTMCKPFHAGRASMAGLMAALLASEGFTSAEDILEGPDGFFKVLTGSVNKDIVMTLGKTWEIENMAQKYHASCHATHSPIEAALEIVGRERLTPESIKSITIHSSKLATGVAGKEEPLTGLEGKFSISYCVANALLRGNTGMQAFTDEKVLDTKIKECCKKITVTPDEEIQQLEARVEIETIHGDSYSSFSNILDDIPDFDTKLVKIKDKFTDLCSPVLGDNKTSELMEAVLTLEKLQNMKKLTRLL